MRTFTLDTNCIYALENDEPAGRFVRGLVEAHKSGALDVALVAASASERQRSRPYYSNYDDFQKRVDLVGLGGLKHLKVIGKFGVSFFGYCIRPTEEGSTREREIHQALSPNIEHDFMEFRARTGCADDKTDKDFGKWRNALCDTQMFWAHDNAKRDHFVTTDNGYKALLRNPSFADASILSPNEAFDLVSSET